MTQPTPTLSPEYKTACGAERIYFCTQACLRFFEQDPDPFMAGEVQHPLEEE